MTRNELLQLVDKHFTCLAVTVDDINEANLRLISELGQDVTDELEDFIEEFLVQHQKSPYQSNSLTPKQFNKYRICIVEDSEWLLEEMVDYFEDAGFDVTCCENGQIALDALQSADFDLVLSDIEMPVMTGLELLGALQSRGINVPVFLMSASPVHGMSGQHLKAGAIGFFNKPFSLVQIAEQIFKYLDNK
jgi:CheY-like chemotaxis protein